MVSSQKCCTGNAVKFEALKNETFHVFAFSFPNLAVCVITRDSIRQALRGGITAHQIVRFLRMHTHPQAQKASQGSELDGDQTASARKNLVPPTIVDQIHLWEKERNRYLLHLGLQKPPLFS